MSRVIFDGLEGAPAWATFPCAACGGPIGFDLWAFASAAATHERISDADVAAFGLTRKPVLTFVVTLAPDGASAHVGELACPACQRRHRVAIGLGEFQPCRYIASFVAAIPL